MLDITWTLPTDYAIPNDATKATMTCTDPLGNGVVTNGDNWSVW
jgi:hypothetical protein